MRHNEKKKTSISSPNVFNSIFIKHLEQAEHKLKYGVLGFQQSTPRLIHSSYILRGRRLDVPDVKRALMGHVVQAEDSVHAATSRRHANHAPRGALRSTLAVAILQWS